MTDTEDPFRILENAVARQQAEEKAARAMLKAYTGVIIGPPGVEPASTVFFGSLVNKLTPVVNWDVPTLATDGKTIAYNPEFINSLSDRQAIGSVVHEVMHNALSHHARRAGRPPKKWNIGTDLAINPTIIQAGFSLPAGFLMPGEGDYKGWPVGLSAEEYCARMQQEGKGDGQQGDDPQEPGDGDGEGDSPGVPDPGGCGAVTEPGDGSESAQREAEAEWEVNLNQALQAARQQGKLPGGLARLIDQALAPRVDWKAVLREFIRRFARSDYSWTPPNRRFLCQGMYLPGLRSEELGDVVVAVDTSGSIGQATLSKFAGELQGILEAYDVSLTILYHDAAIQHVQTWRSSDGPLLLEPKGGGGTSHVPVWEWIDSEAGDPSCVVCLTDLYTHFGEGPKIPLLWAVVGNPNPRAPFGQIVKVD